MPTTCRGEPRVVWPRTRGRRVLRVDHAVVDGEDVLLILHNDGRAGLRARAGRGIRSRRARAQIVIPHRPGTGCWASSTLPRLGRGRLPPRRPRPPRHARRTPTAPSTEIAFDEPLYTRRHRRQPRVGSAAAAARLRLVRHPGHGLRLRRRHRRAAAAQAPARARRLRPRRLRAGARVGDGRRTARRCRSRWCGSARSAMPARAPRPVHLYGYGSYEHSIEPGLLGAAPVGARPRRRLRRRARARRRRDGPAVVRGRQAAAQAQHVHRLRRLRAAPGRQRLHDARPHRRRGRQRRAAC